MPTVLITGLNGFVAVHTALKFLENGWSIRGTVRSTPKGDVVKSLPVFEKYKDKIEIVIVEDFVEGDFTKALDGVDAVAHCASPWHFNGKTWESYKGPAVKGTTNILEQAKKVESIKAISVVSSFASIGDFSKSAYEQAGKVYNEEDWLPWKEEDVKDLKAEEGGAVQWYCASKKYAELAAIETHKNGANYSLSTICPPVILGPAIHVAPGTASKDFADVSTTDTYNAIASGKDGNVTQTPFPLWADVRNVADAIYYSIDKKQTGRFALCNGVFDYQGLANRARELFPDYANKGQIPVGKPEETPSEKGCFKLDGSKAEKELGIKYYSKDDMIKDSVEQFVQIGTIKA